MIRCACLLETRDDAIMLARVRDNSLWYLPGGTIEVGETPEQTLVREIEEELAVQVDSHSIVFERRIVGPALGRDDDVELNCFRAKWHGHLRPSAEVSEIAFIPYSATEKMAPAIKILVAELQGEGAPV